MLSFHFLPGQDASLLGSQEWAVEELAFTDKKPDGGFSKLCDGYDLLHVRDQSLSASSTISLLPLFSSRLIVRGWSSAKPRRGFWSSTVES